MSNLAQLKRAMPSKRTYPNRYLCPIGISQNILSVSSYYYERSPETPKVAGKWEFLDQVTDAGDLVRSSNVYKSSYLLDHQVIEECG